MQPDEIADMGALNSLRGTVGMIAGPALGGMLIATTGLATTYCVDFLSFTVSLLALVMMGVPRTVEQPQNVSSTSIIEGFKYAVSRQELIGTYAIDFIAMVFGMPIALFPEIAEKFGGAQAVGWLYSAPAFGAFLVSLFSGWTKQISRHGVAIAISASLWGLAIIAFGFSTNFWLSLFFLMLAGSADMTSGIFRSIIWNGTIPDRMRGRLAGIEMLSYSSGPLFGNVESGMVAAMVNTQFSVISGGVFCIVGVIVCAARLPKFWRYNVESNSGSQIS